MKISLSEESLSFEFNEALDRARIPRHVALIMDGNRRWARKRGLPTLLGYREGAANLNRIVRVAADLGIKALTVYAFSTENWNRSWIEVQGLLQLITQYLRSERGEMVKQGVRLQAIGDLARFPKDLRDELEKTKQFTSQGARIDLILALNYGGRDDICRATKALIEDVISGRIQKSAISEQLFSRYLDTAPWQDPALLIRTSGEMRLSNFLLWQLSYTEVYTTQTLWPDFDQEEFVAALMEYQQRTRRLGE